MSVRHSCDCEYRENQVCDICQGVTIGKEIHKREPESKDAQIKILREALEKLEKYIANNGDCWVQNVARQALAEIDKIKEVKSEEV